MTRNVSASHSLAGLAMQSGSRAGSVDMSERHPDPLLHRTTLRAPVPEMSNDRRYAPGPVAAEPSDVALLHGLLRRDEAALAALYERYAGLVYTLALRIVGDRDLAGEVLQDVFLRCWEHAQTFQSHRGHVAGWLLGIARNRAIDLLRSRQHQARLRERERLPAPGAREEPAQTDVGEDIALRETVSAALEALPAAQRQAIELAYYGGLTQAEIAQRLGEPLGTIKTRIRDGMERLRRLLRPVMEPDREESGRHG